MNRNMRKCYSRLARLRVHVGRLEEELALTRFSPGFPDPTLCKGKGGCLGFPGSCLIAGAGGKFFLWKSKKWNKLQHSPHILLITWERRIHGWYFHSQSFYLFYFPPMSFALVLLTLFFHFSQSVPAVWTVSHLLASFPSNLAHRFASFCVIPILKTFACGL